MDDLVSPTTLATLLRQAGPGDLCVLDATYLPFEPDRDAAAEYRAGHIPGARFLDLATLCDPASPLPATVPPAPVFVARMGALGVTRAQRIILYDNSPYRTAARAWWLLRLFGAARVTLLDGGLAGWQAAGLPLETGESASAAIPAEATGFGARDDSRLRTIEQMKALIGQSGTGGAAAQIVDARGAARFTGAEADPRPGIAPGHMPGARNLPYGGMFAGDGRWKSPQAIAQAFEAAGVDPAAPMVFTCGSGITASTLMFGAHLAGRDDSALYDGSWSEWGADPSAPKANGPAAAVGPELGPELGAELGAERGA